MKGRPDEEAGATMSAVLKEVPVKGLKEIRSSHSEARKGKCSLSVHIFCHAEGQTRALYMLGNMLYPQSLKLL